MLFYAVFECVVIKLAGLDMVHFTPGFVRHPTGTAFLDQIQPFLVRPSGMSFLFYI